MEIFSHISLCRRCLTRLRRRRCKFRVWAPGLTGANASITSDCLVSLVERRHHWSIFLWKWERHNHYGQWRHLLHYKNRFFCTHSFWCSCEWYLILTGWCNLPHISCHLIRWNGDINWMPRNCYLTPLDYLKCHADKRETIEHLKANIRESIAEIRPPYTRKSAWKLVRSNEILLGSCGSHINEIIFHF